MTIVNLYTDGACSGNQNETNIGGWGAVLEYGGHKKELYGGEINTTNNRMEMMALLSALKAMKREGLVIHVYSDSSYLMDCFRKKWYVNWQKNGWKTSQKTDVENKDLWMALLDEVKKHQVSFYGGIMVVAKNTDTIVYMGIKYHKEGSSQKAQWKAE